MFDTRRSGGQENKTCSAYKTRRAWLIRYVCPTHTGQPPAQGPPQGSAEWGRKHCTGACSATTGHSRLRGCRYEGPRSVGAGGSAVGRRMAHGGAGPVRRGGSPEVGVGPQPASEEMSRLPPLDRWSRWGRPRGLPYGARRRRS